MKLSPKDQLNHIDSIQRMDITEEQYEALDDYRMQLADLMDKPLFNPNEWSLKEKLEEIGLGEIIIF
jgi:hypothetical protein